MNDGDSDHDDSRHSHDAVWEAMGRFSEALRQLDDEVRALAQLFDRPLDARATDDRTPGRMRQSYGSD